MSENHQQELAKKMVHALFEGIEKPILLWKMLGVGREEFIKSCTGFWDSCPYTKEEINHGIEEYKKKENQSLP